MLDKALERYEMAPGIRVKVLGPEHNNVARFLNIIGILYKTKGALDKALERHEKALGIKIKVLGPEHASVAPSLDNNGKVYFKKGAPDETLECHEKALGIRIKVHVSAYMSIYVHAQASAASLQRTLNLSANKYYYYYWAPSTRAWHCPRTTWLLSSKISGDHLCYQNVPISLDGENLS